MSANGRLCSLGAGGHGQLSGASGTSAQGGWQAVHLPVSSYIQHVQLSCVGEFRRQNGQAVIPQGEDAERHTAPNLGRQHLQAVPVHIEVGQLAQLPQGAG